jgi:hypothetical protein
MIATQRADGGWRLMQSRAIPIQPIFDSGFPHGSDQRISTAGTAWAALAVTLALD